MAGGGGQRSESAVGRTIRESVILDAMLGRGDREEHFLLVPYSLAMRGGGCTSSFVAAVCRGGFGGGRRPKFRVIVRPRPATCKLPPSSFVCFGVHAARDSRGLLAAPGSRADHLRGRGRRADGHGRARAPLAPPPLPSSASHFVNELTDAGRCLHTCLLYTSPSPRD